MSYYSSKPKVTVTKNIKTLPENYTYSQKKKKKKKKKDQIYHHKIKNYK